MRRKRKESRKEEIAESVCFFCKDGGSLRICDKKNCLKAYHPACVKRNDDLLETDERWLCGWHFCFLCGKQAKFQCFTCPISVCGACLWDAEFAQVKGKKGFCNRCTVLGLLLEEDKSTKSNECQVDFDDQDTYEYMFKAYWEIAKQKEDLTKKHLLSANNLLKKNKNFAYVSDSDDRDEEEDDTSEFDDLIGEEEQKPKFKRKRSDRKPSSAKTWSRSKKTEFVGWASKPLLAFLESIGEEPTKELSQYDLTSIVTKYCQEKKLFNPEKKKKVICDSVLHSLFGKWSVNKNSIYKLLSRHFAENLEQSGSEIKCDLDNNNENQSEMCKRSSKSCINRNSQDKAVSGVEKSCFAAVFAKNIKLVYLKRSVVEKLAKEPDTFTAKIMESFVRVKSDPNDYLQRNSHQLVQVTGIRSTGSGQVNSKILLQVSNMIYDIPICKLSDDDFSQEECDDLQRRMKDGLPRRPTVVELEKKARSLHKDITEHWIAREMAVLQGQIDHANEKGWRRELFGYIDRLQLLRDPAEQARLLNEVPEVIADIAEPEAVFEENQKTNNQQNNASEENSPEETSQASVNDLKRIGTSCFPAAKKKTTDEDDNLQMESRQDTLVLNQDSLGASPELSPPKSLSSAPEDQARKGKHHSYQGTASKEQNLPQRNQSEFLPSVCNGCSENNMRQSEADSTCKEQDQHESLAHAPEGHSKNQKDKSDHATTSNDERQPENFENNDVENKDAPPVEVVELSSDDEEDEKLAANLYLERPIWYCWTQQGETKGPYSMALLKEWYQSRDYELKFKVFKTDQSRDEAIFLKDAISRLS